MVWRGMMEANLKGWMLAMLNLGTFTVLGTLGETKTDCITKSKSLSQEACIVMLKEIHMGNKHHPTVMQQVLLITGLGKGGKLQLLKYLIL